MDGTAASLPTSSLGAAILQALIWLFDDCESRCVVRGNRVRKTGRNVSEASGGERLKAAVGREIDIAAEHIDETLSGR